MKKKPKNKKWNKGTTKKKPIVQTPLELYNAKSYIKDYAIIAKFSSMSDSTKDWIEVHRYDLQNKANKYEHFVGNYLIKKGVNFIHQAPFVINRMIYFLDFFIPTLRVALEIDGIYHSSSKQNEKDSFRDKDFKTIGIKTIRISNDEAKDEKILDIRMKAEGIVKL